MAVHRYAGIEVPESVGGIIAGIQVGVWKGGESDGQTVLLVGLRDEAEQVVEIPLGPKAVQAFAIALLATTIEISAEAFDRAILEGKGPLDRDTLTKVAVSALISRFQLDTGELLDFSD